jgi:hypothetical protein
MSSPIIPIEGLSDLPTVTSSADGSVEYVGAFASELATGGSTLALVAGRGGPPAEVLDQIALAASIEEQLRENGRQLRFLAAQDGRTRIEIHDREGDVVGTLSTAEALEVAAGKPLE